MVSCYCRQLLNHLTYSRLCPTLSNYVCRSEDTTLKAMPELVQEYHQNGLRLNSVTLISYLHQLRHKIPIGRKTRGEKNLHAVLFPKHKHPQNTKTSYFLPNRKPSLLFHPHPGKGKETHLKDMLSPTLALCMKEEGTHSWSGQRRHG